MIRPADLSDEKACATFRAQALVRHEGMLRTASQACARRRGVALTECVAFLCEHDFDPAWTLVVAAHEQVGSTTTPRRPGAFTVIVMPLGEASKILGQLDPKGENKLVASFEGRKPVIAAELRVVVLAANGILLGELYGFAPLSGGMVAGGTC